MRKQINGDTLRINAAELDHRQNNAIQSKLLNGGRVLVRSDGTKRSQAAIRNAFGITSESKLFVAQKDTSGHLFVDATIPGEHNSAAAEEQLLKLAEKTLDDVNSEKPKRFRRDANDSSAYAPAFEGTFSFHSPDNSVAMRKDYHVLRQIRKQGDQFRVLVKDTYTITPPGIGLGKDYWRALLYVINSVETTSLVSGENVELARQEPSSDSRTDFTVLKNITSETGFSVGAGLEGAGGQKERDLTAKAPVSFGFNSRKTVSEEISYSVKDYRIEAGSKNESHMSEATTKTVLADAIRANKAYFNTSGLPDLSEANMTPWMRSQTFSQVNEWLVPVKGNPYIAMASNVSRDLLQYHGKADNFESQPDPIVTHNVTTKGFYVQVDLDSPLLSRSPSVYIQSADGTAQFIGAPNGHDVVLGTPREAMDRAYLWSFDEEGRYINALSGKALTWHPADSKLTVETKSLDREQQWQWRADRLHNARSVDGTSYVGRIVVEGNAALGSNGVNYPINENSPLLDPWSSYPDPPVAGDVVPRLTGPQRPIPPSWITDGYNPKTSERWTVTMFRRGILD